MPAETVAGAGAAREGLARRQAELLAALVGGGPAPEGFDPDRLRVQARALLDKRRRVVAAHLPDLAEALGEQMPRLFAGYAEGQPRPPGGPHADAAAFTAHLRARGLLPRGTGPRRWARLPGRLRRLRPGR
ncbi:hypothetical protein GCM10010300_79330 [Streptomyces olivaceoviridis]|nr:hypothetical protein GCM10010300_79330 [Streptomyces olivaceoviridis]